ncbi:MAG: hypothetical protein AB7H80_04830 [Candidatus Kapaibacterium sp.]
MMRIWLVVLVQITLCLGSCSSNHVPVKMNDCKDSFLINKVQSTSNGSITLFGELSNSYNREKGCGFVLINDSLFLDETDEQGKFFGIYSGKVVSIEARWSGQRIRIDSIELVQPGIYEINFCFYSDGMKDWYE